MAHGTNSTDELTKCYPNASMQASKKDQNKDSECHAQEPSSMTVGLRSGPGTMWHLDLTLHTHATR